MPKCTKWRLECATAGTATFLVPQSVSHCEAFSCCYHSLMGIMSYSGFLCIGHIRSRFGSSRSVAILAQLSSPPALGNG